MSSKEPRFMRFVVRPDCQGGIVGLNFNLFEEGQVYEVAELLGGIDGITDGEYVIRKVGPSPLSIPLGQPTGIGINNGADYNGLYSHIGPILRTLDEHKASALEQKRAAARSVLSLAPCASVRVDFGDETSWGEYVGEGVFMSTNQTLSNVPLKVPEGHAQFANNGKTANMKWGHFFRGEMVRATVVRPTFIIGHIDESFCSVHAAGPDAAVRCHRCKRYAELIDNALRSDAEERLMVDLHLWLKGLEKDPGWVPVPRRERGQDDPTIVPA